MSELREAWESKDTISCFEQISTNGKKVKTKECFDNGLYPVVDQGQSEIAGYVNDLDKVIHVEDPLIIFGDHTRAIKWISHDFVPGADGTKVLKPKSFLDNRFSYFQLKYLDIPDRGYSRHFQFLKDISFSIPPLNEQIRIANKLDSLLSKVDAAQTRLEKIPTLLKRFRQSILAAATSGELTKEWRKEKNAANWNSRLLQDVANVIDPQPSHRTPPEVSGGVPYIGIGDLNDDGTIDFERARKVSTEVLDEHKNRYKLKKGDFIFGKIGTLGKPTVLPTNREFTLSANVILIQPNSDLVDATYLAYFLSSPETMSSVANQATSTSQAAFGIKKMRAFSCEIPSKDEQKEIVRRVESLFALADSVEKQYTEATKRTDRLTQSLLAKAFRGELVPQDPNDEPASELLKRIQAEREQQAATKPKRKTAKGKATATASGNAHVTTKRKDQKKATIREKYASVIDDACKNLKGRSFSIEQFRSVSGFSGEYETLKALILNLLNGIPEVSEPLLTIDSWDDKTGDYRLKVKT